MIGVKKAKLSHIPVKGNRIRRTKGEICLTVIVVIVLSLLTFLCIYPIWFFVINSLSAPLWVGRASILPRMFTLYNYSTIFQDRSIYAAFGMSVMRTVAGTTATLICSSFVAYLFTHKYMPMKRLFYRMIIFTMFFNAGMIPWYLTMRAYGLQNNFLLYIVPTMIVPFYMILLKTFFESIPQALTESAEIDGAGVLKIYAYIILPVSVPILASVTVFAAIAQWNSWFDNFLLNNRHEYMTLQLLLYQYLQRQMVSALSPTATASEAAAFGMSSNPLSVRMTISMITMLPIMMVYPFMQKYFIQGIMLGSVKG